MKKLMLLPAMLCLLVLTSCGGLYHDAYLAESSGTVTLVRDGKETELTSSKKGFKHQDTILTAEQSSARVRLDGGKEIVAAGGTEVGLFDNGKSVQLELRSGSLLARLEKPLETAETFDVILGGVSLSARESTALFSAQWISPTEALLNVYLGRVAAASSRTGGELITLSAGQAVHFHPTDAALLGEAGPIDDTLLPDALAPYVEDYAKGGEPTPSKTTTEPQEPGSAVSETAEPSPEQGTAAPSEQPIKPSAPPSRPAESAPEPTVPPAEKPADTPQDHPREEPAAPKPEDGPDLPAAPEAKLRYLWDGGSKRFQPRLSVSWSDARAHHIDWQLCDAQGAAAGQGGTLTGEPGAVSGKEYPLDLGGELLRPQGYALALTPYYTAGKQDDPPAALAPVYVELPYLVLTSERSQDKRLPVISTNIGFWFQHAVSALTVETQQTGKLRVYGELYPLEGEKKPLEIDVYEK